jgi:hypothetical protein
MNNRAIVVFLSICFVLIFRGNIKTHGQVDSCKIIIEQISMPLTTINRSVFQYFNEKIELSVPSHRH